MADAPAEPRYRFWGNKKPIAMMALADTAEKAGKSVSMRMYGPIDSWGAPFGVSADEFGQALASLGDDVDTIDLHMHSPGGEVFEGLAIMNQLRAHKAAVNVTVDGIAASIASVICLGADTVAMAPGAQMMVHDASGICIGTAQDMATMNTRLESLSSNIAEQYAARAGGSAEDWRAAMQPESWFKAQEAVDAGLADRVLTKDEAAAQDKAPKAEFDLSMFAYAGRDHAPAPTMPAARAPQTPAAQPVAPSTDPKEADTMSDTLLQGLRKQLGLPDDADEATVLAANAEALTEKADPPPAPPAPAPVAQIPEGKVLVDQAQWDDVKAQAALGAAAHAKQDAEDRDKVIEQARADGKISAALKPKLAADWDADVKAHGNADQTRQRLAEMSVIYPVGPASGYAGDDGSTGTSTSAFTDAEADELAQLTGTRKEALLS